MKFPFSRPLSSPITTVCTNKGKYPLSSEYNLAHNRSGSLSGIKEKSQNSSAPVCVSFRKSGFGFYQMQIFIG